MDSLDKIMDKMEAPLAFAMGDSYNRLSLIKNLETVMTSLLQQLKREIKRDRHGSQKDELERLSDTLLNLFDGYDVLPQQQKMERLSLATLQMSELKTILQSTSMIEGKSGRDTETKADRNALQILSRPVQFIPGIGPRTAALLARKNLLTIEDLLYFLPRRYEDRRTV